MRVLLIGKTGQLGGSLLIQNKEHDFFSPNKDELNILSKDSILRAIRQFKPEVIINTAAFHNVPQCEIEPERAFQINCFAVQELSTICKEERVKLVTFSTDYVFGGEKATPYSENDKPHPLQLYGISRLAGEYAALSSHNDSIVIRTCGLYGIYGASSKGGNFVDKRINDAKLFSEIEMGVDQIVSPTFTHDLADAVLELIKRPDATGVYHLVNEGFCSWYEFTEEIYRLMKIKTKLIPVDRNGQSGEMLRPKFSALENTRSQEIGIKMRYWKAALQDYLNLKYQI